MNLLKENSNIQKTKNLFRNFALMILCYLFFFILVGYLKTYFPEIDLSKYEQSKLFENLKENPLKFIFLASIFAPVIEESMFRSLVKPSAISIKLFVCSLLYFAGLMIIPQEGNWFLKYGLLFLSLFLVYYAMGELISFAFFERMKYLLHRHYLLVWILGSILFGFVHIFNYVEVFYVDMALFILIFPRIIAGFFFGKIKLENRGLIWPILMHSMNNTMVLILILPSILSKY